MNEYADDLAGEYRLRFAGREIDRARVWRVLVREYFQPLMGDDKVVLELGCGWGEFINQIEARERYGMGLNPDVAGKLRESVNFLMQDVFGSRLIKGGKVVGYPPFKRFQNRHVNGFTRVIFGTKLNDTTNAFKAYRATVIEGCRSFLSPHFNLTVELPRTAGSRSTSAAATIAARGSRLTYEGHADPCRRGRPRSLTCRRSIRSKLSVARGERKAGQSAVRKLCGMSSVSCGSRKWSGLS